MYSKINTLVVKKNKYGFTLIELIITVVILSILSTIAGMSYVGYTSSSRDTARMTQLDEIYKGINTYIAKQKTILPESNIKIKSGTKVIGYQGYVGKKILNQIGYSEEGVDPLDGTEYTIYMTKNKKYFELLAFLENPPEGSVESLVNNRIPYVKGDNLGVLVDENNIVIQEVPSIKSAGEINISDVGNLVLKSYIRDSNDFITGSGITFAPMETFAQVGGQFCKKDNLTCGVIVKADLSICAVENGGLLNNSGSNLCTSGGINTYFNIVGMHYVWDCDNGEQKVECQALNVCTFDEDNIGECVFG